jgi:transmembrane sensor
MSKDSPTSAQDSANDPLDALLARALRPPTLSSDFDARLEAALAKLPAEARLTGEATRRSAKPPARPRKKVDYAVYEALPKRRGLLNTLVTIAFAMLLGPVAFLILTLIDPPTGSLSARRPNTPSADETSSVYIGGLSADQPVESTSAKHRSDPIDGTRSAHVDGHSARRAANSPSARRQNAPPTDEIRSVHVDGQGGAGLPADKPPGGLQWDLPGDKTLTAGVGERRSISIGDSSGSSIVMNTASFIRLKNEGSLLHVEVLRGEVLFDMRPDPPRQLRVSLGRLSVLDTATIFAVQITDEGELRVTVQEGQVRVSAPQLPEILLSQNEQVIASDTGQVMDVRTRRLSPDDIARQLSWRHGSLEFQCERISEVVRQLNRYSLTKIEIVDPALGNERIGGSFDIDAVTFAALITSVFPNVQVDAATNQDGSPVLTLHSRGSGLGGSSDPVEPPCRERN